LKRATNHILICLDTQETLDLVDPTCELCDAKLNSVAPVMSEPRGEIIDDNQETLWSPEWDSEASRP